jgi:hypothetical protein
MVTRMDICLVRKLRLECLVLAAYYGDQADKSLTRPEGFSASKRAGRFSFET